jgi:hypothetical protein
MRGRDHAERIQQLGTYDDYAHSNAVLNVGRSPATPEAIIGTKTMHTILRAMVLMFVTQAEPR